MTRDEVVRFFHERQRHWVARDIDALANQHAPNGTVHSPMFGNLSGRAAIAESYHRLYTAFPDWSTQPDELIVDGDTVAQPFKATATHVGEFMGLPGTKHRTHIQRVLAKLDVHSRAQAVAVALHNRSDHYAGSADLRELEAV